MMKTPVLLALALCAACARAVVVTPSTVSDPYLWLEELDSPRAMQWVAAHDAITVKALSADARYQTLYEQSLAIAGAKDRVPYPALLHGEVFNFWQDPDHLRGLWRKTTLADYRAAEPQWKTVIDIDALNKAEGKSWVWEGFDCLEPEENRCLVSLSNGGEDAHIVREFDLDTGAFVEGGFSLPRGKHRVAWEDKDKLLVATEWTPGELTTSGYPYVVKRLQRGQPLSAATEVFRGTKEDGGYGVSPSVKQDGAGNRLVTIVRPLDTFKHETYLLDGALPKKLNIPGKVRVEGLVAGRVLYRLDEPWGQLEAGTVAMTELAATKISPGSLAPTLVWAPSAKESLRGLDTTKDKLLLTFLDNVQGRAAVLEPAKNGWVSKALKLADNASIDVEATSCKSNQAFINVTSFLLPTTLLQVDLDAGGEPTQVKSLPAKFDASRHVVEQLEATSSDGTKVPYYVVRPRDAKLDGSTPTLMTAYGGFMSAMTPSYAGTRGKLWLERGGAFVLANIRGGSEFGPKWHEAGLGAKRQVIYDDFAAVAKDLIERKLTSPRRLGIQGGSNGGLLVGVEMVQHPELWNAVVIAVPLLDMIRIANIAAGASWQGEFGDVAADPKVRAFWEKTSPYQNLKRDAKYPEPFIWTTTKDDRVGPQHARKFAARMEEYQLPYLFYENTEGGHGSGADLVQRSRVESMTTVYLLKKLFD